GALAALQTQEQSLAAATRAVFALWGVDAAATVAPVGATLEAADEALRVAGLTTMPLRPGEADRLGELDLPALVALRAPDGGTRFALLRRISAGSADLEGIVAGQSVRVDVSEWMRHWTGEALVPWRDFAGLPPSLGPGDQGAPVEWLQDA